MDYTSYWFTGKPVFKLLSDNKCDKNNKISCTKLILGLIEDDYHVVFLDKFLINRKTIRPYG